MVFARQSNIWRSPGDGVAPQPITNLQGGAYAEYPTISPDGGRIAFVAITPAPVTATMPLPTLYRALEARHALLLEPGTAQIRIANPFSAVPTSFEVTAQGQTYWANCAWDAFGIPAALHADADIQTSCAFTGTPLYIQVRGAAFSGDRGLVHFALPCRRWYDDLVFT